MLWGSGRAALAQRRVLAAGPTAVVYRRANVLNANNNNLAMAVITRACASTRTPTSIDVLNALFTWPLKTRISPRCVGVKKWRSSTEAVTTSVRQCVWAMIRAHFSIQSITCPPNVVPSGLVCWSSYCKESKTRNRLFLSISFGSGQLRWKHRSK